MVTTLPITAPGFCPVVQNPQFKCAFITPSAQYSFGEIAQMKRHNDTDEIFVLLSGTATLLTLEEGGPQTVALQKNIAYNVCAGTLHHLAVSEDAVVFVTESGSMDPKNTETILLHQPIIL